MDFLEEEMQERVEKNNNASTPVNSDEKMYQMVFDTLNEKESKEPSYAFSFNVIRKIKTRQNYQSGVTWSLVLPALIVLIFLILYVAAPVYNNSMAHSMLSFIYKFRIQFFCLLGVYYLLQFINEKKVIEKFVR